MYVVNEDKSIYATRGDMVRLAVSANNNGVPYVFQPGEIVRFRVFEKKGCHCVVLQKDFAITERVESVDILLTKEETKIGEVISKPKDYWYEVELNPNNNPQTIVGYDDDGPKVFRLFPEGVKTSGDDNEITPGDIPIVDANLDMTSERPIQNQAVAREIVMLSDDIKQAEERLNGSIQKTASDVELLKNHVTPQMYGAVADGATDDTAAIQAAIDANSNVLIPEGTYAIHGTLALNGGKTVTLQNKATLVKPSTATNTDPVIHITGNYNSLIGSGLRNGLIKSEVASPFGVLLIGDKGMDAEPTNTCYNTVADLAIEGYKAGGNQTGDPVRGVYICCADGYVKAVYFATVRDVLIKNANDGLYMEGNANANIVYNVQFNAVGNNKWLNGAAIHLKNTDGKYPLENTVQNSFHHQSSNAVSIRIDGGVLFNSLQNILCEQGGTSAQGIVVSDADNMSQGNNIMVVDNCAGGNSISSDFYQRNTVQRRGYFGASRLSAVVLQRKNSVMVQEGQFRISEITDGTSVKVLTINAGKARTQTITVEVDLGAVSPKTGSSKLWGSHNKAVYQIVTDDSYAISVKKVSALSDYGVFNEPIIDGRNVIFSARIAKFTGTLSDNAFHCNYKVFGLASQIISITEHDTMETITDTKLIPLCVAQDTTNGTTENRPSTKAVGLRYFDTTLGKPIWWNGTKWVDASGADA